MIPCLVDLAPQSMHSVRENKNVVIYGSIQGTLERKEKHWFLSLFGVLSC